MTASHILVVFFTVLLVSGIFSMFGKGGGSLYTPVFVMLGVGLGTAITTALFLNFVTALVATVVFWRNKLVDLKFSSLFLPGTIVGSLIGAALSSHAPKGMILGIFSAFLYAAGIWMVISAKTKESGETRPVSWKTIALITLFSFFVGVLSSLIGVGGGLVIFPFLVLYMKYGAQKAAGANSFIVMISSIVGTGGHYAAAGSFDYRMIIIASVACIIGSAVGSHVTVKAHPAFVKVAFAFIMWFFATQIAYQLLRNL